VTWLIHMCDMTHSYVWHDSFICVTWLIHMCDKTHSYVWHDSFICVTWLIHMCDMTHSYVWHDSVRSSNTNLSGKMFLTERYVTFGGNTGLFCVNWSENATPGREKLAYRIFWSKRHASLHFEMKGCCAERYVTFGGNMGLFRGNRPEREH